MSMMIQQLWQCWTYKISCCFLFKTIHQVKPPSWLLFTSRNSKHPFTSQRNYAAAVVALLYGAAYLLLLTRQSSEHGAVKTWQNENFSFRDHCHSLSIVPIQLHGQKPRTKLPKFRGAQLRSNIQYVANFLKGSNGGPHDRDFLGPIEYTAAKMESRGIMEIWIMEGFAKDCFVEFLSFKPPSNKNILSVQEQVFNPAVSHMKIANVHRNYTPKLEYCFAILISVCNF